MPWSAAKKRAMRAQKKQEQAELEKQQGKRMLELAPPQKLLKKPPKKEHLGDSNVDYGGHWKVLNFPDPPPKGELQLSINGVPTSMHSEPTTHKVTSKKCGSLNIGLVYDSDFKAKSKLAGKGVEKRCKISNQYLDFLYQIKDMLEPKVEETLKHWMDESMRVNILYGARTKAHTDSYRGNTPNFLYIVDDGTNQGGGGCLLYDTFPKFRCSVVSIGGKYYVPHGYSSSDQCIKCIGENPKKPGYPIYCIFPLSALDYMLPVGDLPYGIIGWRKNGNLAVIPEYEGVCLYTKPSVDKPTVFATYKWKEVIDKALSKPVSKRPRKRIVTLAETNTWMEFRAYKYRHWWIGNPNILRYHAFFRTVREVPTSSNLKGKKPGSLVPKNFVHLPLPDDPGPDSATKGATSESPKPACKSEPLEVPSGPVPVPDYLEFLPDDQWYQDDLSSVLI